MAKKAKDTTSIGFEEKIWKAADILRGNLSASQYEGVVLGLIFLKYISDRFDQKFQELQGDDYADPEDKDEYTADNIFFVPQEARWSKISAAAHRPEIGEVIDGALSAIERENQRLKGILPKNFARPELDKRRLGEVVDLFTNVAMHDAGEEKDLLGRTYEYCLQQFASLEGKNGGEFYTPSCIVRTLVEILEPYEGRVYDPCCGSGTILIEGAMMAHNIAPGINRNFECDRWGFIPEKAWIQERERCHDIIKTDTDFVAFGSDIHFHALELTMANAKRIKVDKFLRLETADIKDFNPTTEKGTLITNPPYGERMLDVKTAKNIYHIMGEKFVSKHGWSYGIISPDEEFEREFGRKADKRRKLYNGMIKCQYYMYFK